METILAFLALLSIAIAGGFLFEGVERKLFARLQNRKGPPLLQPLYDALKLLLAKETVIPANASPLVFVLAPYISAAAAITAVLFIPLGGSAPLAFNGDLIVLLYTLALSTAALFLGASASGSPFAALGASREMTLYISLELSLALAVLAPAFAAGSFSLALISAQQFAPLPLAAVVFFVAVLAELGKKPFDISEAEQEIAEGLYAEYSGRLLGMFKIASALKHYIYACMFAVLFVPMPVEWPVATRIAAQLAAALLFVCAMALVRSVSARFRLHSASRFYLSVVAFLAFIQFVLVYLWR